MYKRALQTLLEQMHITDAEIQIRLELVDLNQEAISQLADVKYIIEEKVDTIVEKFYSSQLLIDDIGVLIGDAETLMRLKDAQRQYTLDLFSGQYDATYVNNRLRIGMIHKRIGVEPKLYLSAINTLKRIIFLTLDSEINDSEKLKLTRVSLDKLFYFDTTLVFDAYISSMISEIDIARNKAEMYANSLEQKVVERTSQLQALARRDPLTGLYNQRAMRELMQHEIASAKRRKSCISLVYFDIDDFKDINDSNGHLKGDEILKSLSAIIREEARESDIPCRYGGDEFCVLLPSSGKQEAIKFCERIIHSFSKSNPEIYLSMGIVQTGPEEFIEEDKLIFMADEKMYQAKNVVGSHIES